MAESETRDKRLERGAERTKLLFSTFKKHLKWSLVIFVLIYIAISAFQTYENQTSPTKIRVAFTKSTEFAGLDFKLLEREGAGSRETHGCVINVKNENVFLVAFGLNYCPFSNFWYETMVHFIIPVAFVLLLGIPLGIISLFFYIMYEKKDNRTFVSGIVIPMDIFINLFLLAAIPHISLSFNEFLIGSWA